jgi:putative acetyltransferase
MSPVELRVDDLTSADTLALVTAHLAGMHATSPAESVHALDAAALQHPDVTFYSARVGGSLAGIGALKRLDAARGEIKSMRVADAHLGTGVGRAILRHLIAEARHRGMASLWLETGSTDDFLAARTLYLSEGFAECGPFPPYSPDPFSAYFTRAL